MSKEAKQKSREYDPDTPVHKIFEKTCPECGEKWESFVETCQYCGAFLGRAIV